MVEASLQCKEQLKHGNINISSYVDKLWAKWAASAGILVIEHVHKLATNARCYRQGTQHLHLDVKDRLDKIIQLYCRGNDVIIKSEPTESLASQSTVDSTPTLATPTHSRRRLSVPSPAKRKAESARNDYNNFNGGSLLKAALLGGTDHQETHGEADGQLDEPNGLLMDADIASATGVKLSDEQKGGKGKNTSKGKPSKGSKAPASSKNMPSGWTGSHGRLNIIEKQSGIAYISCTQAGKRNQWLQVNTTQARQPVKLVQKIFEEIKKGTWTKLKPSK